MILCKLIIESKPIDIGLYNSVRTYLDYWNNITIKCSDLDLNYFLQFSSLSTLSLFVLPLFLGTGPAQFEWKLFPQGHTSM